MEDQLIGQYGTANALDEKHGRLYRLREMTDFRADRNGILTATVRLDPASAAVVTAALDALSAPTPLRDENGHAIEPDLRSTGQRRADALVTIAAHATTTDPNLPGTGTKARVVVTMTMAELAGTDNKPKGYATTALGDTLSPSEARLLVCDSHVIPAVLGSDSEILDLGRSTRLITAAQRAALHLRDRGCTYPGCESPPGWCDGHHIKHWSRGGPSGLTNLALLCRHHHTVVHRHNHTATVDGATAHWTRHDGPPIGNTPRHPW